MEAIIIVVAFGLIFAGVYGLLSLFRNQSQDDPDGAPSGVAGGTQEMHYERLLAATQTGRPRASLPAPQPGIGGLFSEVDLLRAQVEHLRSEIVALSGAGGGRPERPQLRRYQTGPYTYLPRELRREVHRARSIRHPMHT